MLVVSQAPKMLTVVANTIFSPSIRQKAFWELRYVSLR
jgi:hypothetical protein